MKEISGYDALRKMEALTKMGKAFTISFFKYSRRRGEASDTLETYSNCICRLPLPAEKFSFDGWNLFLFTTETGEPKMCYKYLIRYVGFPEDNFSLVKVKWFD